MSKMISSGDCLLCQGSGEILVRKARMMGYTLVDGELLDEHFVPCPLCERVEAQRDSSDREWVEWLEGNFSDWEKESDEFQALKQKIKGAY